MPEDLLIAAVDIEDERVLRDRQFPHRPDLLVFYDLHLVRQAFNVIQQSGVSGRGHVDLVRQPDQCRQIRQADRVSVRHPQRRGIFLFIQQVRLPVPARNLNDGKQVLLRGDFKKLGIFADKEAGILVVEAAYDLRQVVMAVGVEIIPEVDLFGKLLIILQRDAHPRVVEIAAHQQDVKLIRVQTLDLTADQPVAEVDDRHRVQIAVVRVLRENQLVMRKVILQRKHRIGKAPVQLGVQGPQPALHCVIMVFRILHFCPSPFPKPAGKPFRSPAAPEPLIRVSSVRQSG